MLAGGEYADADSQVEAGAFLADIGRGEVDGDAPHWHLEAGVCEGGGNAVAGLAHGGVRQADDDDKCLPIAVVDFDLDRVGRNSLDGSAMNVGLHGLGLLEFSFADDAPSEPSLVDDIQLVKPLCDLFQFIKCLEFEQELITVRTQHLGMAFNYIAKWCWG